MYILEAAVFILHMKETPQRCVINTACPDTRSQLSLFTQVNAYYFYKITVMFDKPSRAEPSLNAFNSLKAS